jgi:hypothetical protein
MSINGHTSTDCGEVSEALRTQINAALNAVPTGRTNTTGQPHVCAQQPRVCTPEGTLPRLVAELRLTQDRRDMTIRVAERAWMYTMKSLDRFPRGFILQGEHQCARNDLFEESS